MSRIQLALNVDDVETATAFYAKLFGVQPAKRRPGYANFAIEDPALKLVLIENPGQGGTLNHLGVEVATTAEVNGATQRLASEGFTTRSEAGTECCYAVQDKVWVDGPGGEAWEVYTVLADAPVETDHVGRVRDADDTSSSATDLCCGATPESAARCC